MINEYSGVLLGYRICVYELQIILFSNFYSSQKIEPITPHKTRKTPEKILAYKIQWRC